MRAFVSVLLMTALGLPGCDDADDGKAGADASVTPDTGGTAPILRVGTYNAGLAHGFVDYADERVAAVGPAVAALDLDVLCMQEVWEPADRQAIEAAVAANLPNTFNIPADPGECAGAACQEQETADLVACVEPACSEVPPAMLVGCATDNCGDQVNALSAPCITCISMNIGKSLDEMLEVCGPDAGARGCYAYEGSFGTDILSRYPLTEKQSLVFDSSLNRRAVLYAKATGTAFGDVHVFCTHLTANLSAVPYPGMFGSWGAEQAAQITQMRAFIDEKAGADGKVVVLGDFNCGPAVPNQAEAELVENYEALIPGFNPTYPTQADTECTFCGDNPLVSGVDREHSVLLDHILLRGFGDAGVTASRILDQAIMLESNGMTVDAALSDHYGLQAVIQ